MAEHDCPTCEDSFDSRRGLGVHHSAVHDERLPNRECNRCGAEFYSNYAKKYCSAECHDRAISHIGANYRGAKETTNCEICEEEFEYCPSEKPGKFCGTCVETESWRHSREIEKENDPRWKGGKLILSCEVCDVTVERHPSEVTGEATLCSRDCLKDWVSDAFTGDGHPNWCGGGNEAYGSRWNPVRERALERDGYACVVCGTDADDLGRNPDVHHLAPVRVFVESPLLTVDDAHTLDNVVSLCPSCHRRAEFGHLSRAELRWRAGVQAALR